MPDLAFDRAFIRKYIYSRASSINIYASLAQLVERGTFNKEVIPWPRVRAP